MRPLFLILTAACLLPAWANAQTISGRVVDGASKAPVAYALLLDMQAGKGTYADSSGRFTLTISPQKPMLIQVSRVGYQTRSVDKLSQNQPVTIELQAARNELDQVQVTAKRTRYKTSSLGYFKRLRVGYTEDYTPNTASSLAVFMKPPLPGDNFLSELQYRFMGNKSELVSRYRVRARVRASEAHRPGKDLTTTDLIADVETSQPWLLINVDSLAIQIPDQGFWLELDMIGYTDHHNVFHVINTTRQDKDTPVAPFVGMAKGESRDALQCNWRTPWYSFINWKRPVFMFGVEYKSPL